MTLYYNHAGLTGDALHYAKIQDIFPGNPAPDPEWEGQLYSQGNYLYIARGNPLVWHEIKGAANVEIPSNVITYTMYEAPPLPAEGNGKIHIRPSTKEAWFLTNGEWVQIGGSSAAVPFSEPLNIGTPPPQGFNSVRLIQFVNKYYGFCIQNPPRNFSGDYYNVYPVFSNGALYGGGDLIATITNENFLTFGSPYAGFSGYPNDWENATYLQIFIMIGGTLKKCYFNYDNESRIFKILGYQQ